MSVDTSKRQSSGFWTTLPGILTGIAGVIAAMGGILAVVLNQHSTDSTKTTPVNDSQRAAWVRAANDVCGPLNNYVRGLRPLNAWDGAYFVQAVPQLTSLQRNADTRLRSLPAASGDEKKIERMTGLWDEVADQFDLVVSDLQAGDVASFKADVTEAQKANDEADKIANELGATVCASGPVPRGTQ